MRASAFRFTAAIAAAAAFTPGCGGDTALELPDASDAVDAGTFPFHPDAACLVTVDRPPLLPAPHVPIPTDVTYNSNPPASGPHYAVWAAFQEFAAPVDRRYYVHDLEHGAIVLLYKCAHADGCPDVVKGLESVSASLPNDPLCTDVRVRTVVTPDPLLDTPVAAAAWGYTYTAACLDLPSLEEFARDHYARAPEDECANGVTTF